MLYFDGEKIEKLEKELSDFKVAENEILLVLIGEKAVLNYQEIKKLLNKNDINFFGGIFPWIIFKDHKSNQGILFIKLPVIMEPVILPSINKLSLYSDNLKNMKKIISEQDNPKTALILADARTSNLASFLDNIFDSFANSVDYIGGGAGVSEAKPCIFDNHNLYEKAAVIILLDLSCMQGVRHGLKEIYSPLIATNTEDNIIKELNWKNAFQVYRNQVNDILNKNNDKREITRDEFYNVSRFFPFGIARENEERVARDVISVTEEDGLVCGGEIPQNAVLSLMKVNKNKLIEASGEAVKKIIKENSLKQKEFNISQKIVFDCVTRSGLLGKDYKKELSTICHYTSKINYRNLFGVLTLGEISSSSKGYIEFYNMTTVVGVFYE
ncbi:MAG: FIST signal transduction protein [Candidatus Woesearchaeota archaeon]